MVALLLFSSAFLPASHLPVGDGVRVSGSVGMLERNHVFKTEADGHQKLQFVQFIFWRWDDINCCWQVVAWRWNKKHDGSVVPSSIDWNRRELTYCSDDEFRRVRFQLYRATSSNKDREVWESQHKLPRCLRGGLLNEKKPAVHENE